MDRNKQIVTKKTQKQADSHIDTRWTETQKHRNKQIVTQKKRWTETDTHTEHRSKQIVTQIQGAQKEADSG